MQQPVITWRTKKTATGFKYRVYSFGYKIPEVTLREIDGFKSRDRATLQAKKWCIYFKRTQPKLQAA